MRSGVHGNGGRRFVGAGTDEAVPSTLGQKPETQRSPGVSKTESSTRRSAPVSWYTRRHGLSGPEGREA
jgi:hypothetical protein